MKKNILIIISARELFGESPRKTELVRMAYIMADNNLNGYSIDDFSQHNFWFEMVSKHNNFYNVGYTWGSNEFKIGSFHVLWPLPQSAIDANAGGHINQNEGYPGAETNIPPSTDIPPSQY